MAMLRTALRPRFMGLLALMIVATIVCGLLASWQWDRAHRALRAEEGAPSELGDVREVLDVGDPITNRIVGGIVTATGECEPQEPVLVAGRLEAGESASAGIEDGVSTEIATTMLINEWGGPMYSGYIGQISPAEGLAPMPEAESEFSRNLNWQNIGYSAQWVLFGGFFLY